MAGSSNVARIRARRSAVQALYQWHLAGGAAEGIISEFLRERETERMDLQYFSTLVREVIAHESDLRQHLSPHVDRPWERVGPVERSILLLGAHELAHCPHIPWRAVVNEGVELCKMFGADEAHRFINGVLDRLARDLRKVEIAG